MNQIAVGLFGLVQCITLCLVVSDVTVLHYAVLVIVTCHRQCQAKACVSMHAWIHFRVSQVVFQSR